MSTVSARFTNASQNVITVKACTACFMDIFFSSFSVLLRIVHPKMKMFPKCTLLQLIKGVSEFVSSSEQIWRNSALLHLLTNGSSAVNGCRQNESLNS